MISVAPPQLSSNTVMPISCPQHQCPLSLCFSQNPQGPAARWPHLAPAPLPLLSSPQHFSFCTNAFHALPSYHLVPSSPLSPQRLLTVWGRHNSSFISALSVQQSFHYAALCSFFPLMSHTDIEKKFFFQDSDWNLVTRGHRQAVDDLRRGQVKSARPHYRTFQLGSLSSSL